MLFWSMHARNSKWVRWEWETVFNLENNEQPFQNQLLLDWVRYQYYTSRNQRR